MTKCGRFELEYYPPLIIGTISFVILLIKSTISLRKRRQGNQIHLDTSNDTETRPLLANSNGYGTTEGSDTKLTKEEIKALHFDVARLPDTNIDGKQHGYVQEVYKNISQRLRVCVEYVLVILSLALHISPFFSRQLHREFRDAAFIPLVQSIFWLYVFILVTIRIVNLKKVSIRLPNLWVHTTALYFSVFPSFDHFQIGYCQPNNEDSSTSILHN